jgi:hypothetical protein
MAGHVVVENLPFVKKSSLKQLKGCSERGSPDMRRFMPSALVLAEHIHDVLKKGGEPTRELHAPYFERLKHFSADEWRRSG